jgi:hypothetical protein
MKKNLALKLPLLLIALVGIALPYLASAATLTPASDVWSVNTLSMPLLICQGAAPLVNGVAASGSALPVCQNVCDLVAEFENVLYIMIAYAIWIIAPVAFIAGGIMYMISGANPNLKSLANKTLTGAVVGIIIVLCSYIIIATFIGIFNSTTLQKYIGGFGASCSISNSQ